MKKKAKNGGEEKTTSLLKKPGRELEKKPESELKKLESELKKKPESELKKKPESELKKKPESELKKKPESELKKLESELKKKPESRVLKGKKTSSDVVVVAVSLPSSFFGLFRSLAFSLAPLLGDNTECFLGPSSF